MKKVMVKTIDPRENPFCGFEVIAAAEDGEYTTVIAIPDAVSGEPRDGEVVIPSAQDLAVAVALRVAQENPGIEVWAWN